LEGNNGYTNRTCPDPGPPDRPLQKALFGGYFALVYYRYGLRVESVEDIAFFVETHQAWLKKGGDPQSMIRKKC
jgi:hypothetical protein